MINTWNELWVAVRQWWNTELNFERKPKLPEPEQYKDILRPVTGISSDEWNRIQRASLNKLADQYFAHLQDRIRHGELLNADELDRLQRQDELRRINEKYPQPPKNLGSKE
jgi:hypothetical protein